MVEVEGSGANDTLERVFMLIFNCRTRKKDHCTALKID